MKKPVFTFKKLQAWRAAALFKKEIPTQVFFYECCEIFKNIYLKEHLRMAASDW